MWLRDLAFLAGSIAPFALIGGAIFGVGLYRSRRLPPDKRATCRLGAALLAFAVVLALVVIVWGGTWDTEHLGPLFLGYAPATIVSLTVLVLALLYEWLAARKRNP